MCECVESYLRTVVFAMLTISLISRITCKQMSSFSCLVVRMQCQWTAPPNIAEGPIMVTNCANPKCSLPFKYLHEGTLFRLMLQATERGATRGRETRVEYFWLSPSCSAAFTLVFDERRRVSLVPFGDTRNHKISRTLILDIRTPHPHDNSADPKLSARKMTAVRQSRVPR
jgi:hypothetical protein